MFTMASVDGAPFSSAVDFFDLLRILLGAALVFLATVVPSLLVPVPTVCPPSSTVPTGYVAESDARE